MNFILKVLNKFILSTFFLFALYSCEKKGCMDPTAFNYDPEANVSDSSCIPKVFGCTDSLASNYNPNANIMTDGSCTVYEYIDIELDDCAGNFKCRKVKIDLKKVSDFTFYFIYNTVDTISKSIYKNGYSYISKKVLFLDTLKYSPNFTNSKSLDEIYLPIGSKIKVVQHYKNYKRSNYITLTGSNSDDDFYIISPAKKVRYKVERLQYGGIAFGQNEVTWHNKFLNKIQKIDFWFEKPPDQIEVTSYSFNGTTIDMSGLPNFRYHIKRY